MNIRKIFPGIKKTNRFRLIKFSVYSFLLAILVKSYLHFLGFLGDRIIFHGKCIEGLMLVKDSIPTNILLAEHIASIALIPKNLFTNFAMVTIINGKTLK